MNANERLLNPKDSSCGLKHSPARVELLVNSLESLAVDVGVDLRR